ncbi:MAG TPA: MBL fold metallo-hydrolase [Armatimonadota bacterium]
MRFCIFSSGSKQNCFYLESDQAAVLIDMGLSFRAVRAALATIGRDIADVSGLLISHEHSDHVRGLPMLAKRTTLPVYIHPESQARLRCPLPCVTALHAHQPVTIGDLTIHPFPVSHDAGNTFGFRITQGGRSLFLASDLGMFTEETCALARGCHAIAIEANYDPQALRQCGYPAFLQARISGTRGHLSNEEAMRFLAATIGADTTTAFLLHLSCNSNSHAHVQGQIDAQLAETHSGVRFIIAHRDRALPLLEI